MGSPLGNLLRDRCSWTSCLHCMEGVSVVPPSEVFEKGNPVALNSFDPTATEVVMPPEGGMLVYLTGCKYPKKSFPFPRGVQSCDIAKRGIINSIRFVTGLPGNILRGNVLRSAFVLFGDFTDIIFTRKMDDDHDVYLQERFYCDMVREIYRVGMILAGDDVPSIQFVKCVSMILEFDDAYRYRLQDIMGEYDRMGMMNNPRKEVVRLLKIAQQRDSGGTVGKFGSFIKIMPLLFLIPSFKNTVLRFFSLADVSKIKMDINDWYHTLVFNGYNFGGLNLQTRIDIRNTLDANPTV